jgi:hypothetical protein
MLQQMTAHTLTRGQARLLAFTAGATVANLYYAQPFAATLAAEAERTRVIGTVLSGLLTGILLSRTFAGIVAIGLLGWLAACRHERRTANF